jgi:hypothetical protein
MNIQGPPSKMVRGNSKRLINDDGTDSVNVLSQRSHRSIGEQPKESFMKDNPYTIFHALGKFLYNKSKTLVDFYNTYRNQSDHLVG